MKSTPFARLITQELERIKSIATINPGTQLQYVYPNQPKRYTLVRERLVRSRRSFLSLIKLHSFASFF